jgi:hypothetical protein
VARPCPRRSARSFSRAALLRARRRDHRASRRRTASPPCGWKLGRSLIANPGRRVCDASWRLCKRRTATNRAGRDEASSGADRMPGAAGVRHGGHREPGDPFHRGSDRRCVRLRGRRDVHDHRRDTGLEAARGRERRRRVQLHRHDRPAPRRGASIEERQTTGFVAKQQSWPALPFVVPNDRLVGVDRDACLPTGTGAPVTSGNCPFSDVSPIELLTPSAPGGRSPLT